MQLNSAINEINNLQEHHMTPLVWTYLVYLTVSIANTIWVARTLHANGHGVLPENWSICYETRANEKLRCAPELLRFRIDGRADFVRLIGLSYFSPGKRLLKTLQVCWFSRWGRWFYCSPFACSQRHQRC